MLGFEKTMKIEFDTNEYIKNVAKSGSYHHTFINRENLAAGVLRLEPSEKDTQTPHESDEIYYVIRGMVFSIYRERIIQFQKQKRILLVKT